MKLYRATLFCPGKPILTTTITADNIDQARRNLEAQFSGYRVTSIRPAS
jgi:hypothetical protein